MGGPGMSLSQVIARTLKRLMVGGRATEGATWLARLYDGLSQEFRRVNEFRHLVVRSVVPNRDLPEEALEDMERKYGLRESSVFTNAERLARILERARLDGSGGPDWLQDILQLAGFPLYVHANINNTDPRPIPGELITSSAITGFRTFITWGSFTYSANVQYGEEDRSRTLPRPTEPTIPADPTKWRPFVFLSPFEDRLATTQEERVSVTPEEWRYLRSLIIRTKYVRDWCIAQVAIAS